MSTNLDGSSATGNEVSGNYIGTDKDGEQPLGNNGDGVVILNASGNTVGGATAGRRNVISSNGVTAFPNDRANGVKILGVETGDNTVSGNYIGTDKDGEQALGNTASGITIQGARANTVGGRVGGAGNVISGNELAGIDLIGSSENGIRNNRVGTNAAGTAGIGNSVVGISILNNSDDNTVSGNTVGDNGAADPTGTGVTIASSSSRNQVRGNSIGTNAAGDLDLGNVGPGVFIREADNNTIGGTAGEANVIAFNDVRGVNVESGTGNAILSNSIFSNDFLGIDLGNDNVTDNDEDDPDTGPNNLQNYPFLDFPTGNGTGTTTTTGILDSTPSTAFTVQFFASPDADPSLYGEGMTFLGEQTVETDANGDADFTFTSTDVSEGDFITATATSPGDNTSEFSEAVELLPPPSLSIDDVTVTEGDSGTTNATFTVTREGDLSVESTVEFQTADDTAVAPGDFQQTNGMLTFAPEDTEKTITVPVNGDEVDEDDETFSVNLSNQTGAVIGDGEGVGTITDDDDSPTLSIDNDTVTEGDSGTTDASFIVTLSEASGRTVTVGYTTADDTAVAPGDYQTTSGTLTFQPGDTSEEITVPVNGDRTDEQDERFVVNLSTNPSNASTTDEQGAGTITDDDGAGITVTPTSGLVTTESGGTDTFDVVLDSRPTSNVTIPLTSNTTSEGTVSPLSLTFTPENFDTPQTATVTGVDDQRDDGDADYAIITAVATSDDPNYSGRDAANVSVTNTDNDDAPAISIDDVSVTEGDSGTTDATFTITLDRESSRTVTVDYTTADGLADQPGDYEQQSGALTFDPGQTQKTITVRVNGDTIDEPDETFTVDLSNEQNATIADKKGAGAIADDDQAPALSIEDVTVAEGESGTTDAILTVSLSRESGRTVEVDYATADDSASAGSDYQARSGTVTFAPGNTTRTISVPVNGDTRDEDNEAFLVELSNRTNATVADGRGRATIVDDDGCTIRGTEGDDVLRSTAGKDMICGLGGDDRIDGGGGTDVIEGDDGNDTLIGGEQKDLIKAGNGNDVLKAKDGVKDVLYAGPGSDTCKSDPEDTLRGC